MGPRSDPYQTGRQSDGIAAGSVLRLEKVARNIDQLFWPTQHYRGPPDAPGNSIARIIAVLKPVRVSGPGVGAEKLLNYRTRQPIAVRGRFPSDQPQ
jgi:hypothetical protein